MSGNPDWSPLYLAARATTFIIFLSPCIPSYTDPKKTTKCVVVKSLLYIKVILLEKNYKSKIFPIYMSEQIFISSFDLYPKSNRDL